MRILVAFTEAIHEPADDLAYRVVGYATLPDDVPLPVAA
jgi:hypothetical protein